MKDKLKEALIAAIGLCFALIGWALLDILNGAGK